MFLQSFTNENVCHRSQAFFYCFVSLHRLNLKRFRYLCHPKRSFERPINHSIVGIFQFFSISFDNEKIKETRRHDELSI